LLISNDLQGSFSAIHHHRSLADSKSKNHFILVLKNLQSIQADTFANQLNPSLLFLILSHLNLFLI